MKKKDILCSNKWVGLGLVSLGTFFLNMHLRTVFVHVKEKYIEIYLIFKHGYMRLRNL